MLPAAAAASGAFFLNTAGFIPKVGIVAALKLGFKSKFFGYSVPLSVRSKDISNLKQELKSLKKGEYIVVTGGKGLGKTCLINTALNGTCGVVRVDVRDLLC